MRTSKAIITRSEFLGLVYHDIFNYPLTFEELSFWQIGSPGKRSLSVEKTGIFYHLPGKSFTVLGRTINAQVCERKWQIAQKASSVLAKIPTISFVGVTGALSMGSAKNEDDIDLLVVTAVDSLWITRLVSYFLLRFYKFKVRRAGDARKTDALCLNLWLDEKNLSLAGRRDIYTAHEFLQIQPLIDKKGIFKQLLVQNPWVWEYFPYAKKVKNLSANEKTRSGFYPWVLRQLNFFAYLAQIFYMRKKRTSEAVSRGYAFFHPTSWQTAVLKLFWARSAKIQPNG